MFKSFFIHIIAVSLFAVKCYILLLSPNERIRVFSMSIDLILDGEDFVSQTSFSTNKNDRNGR